MPGTGALILAAGASTRYGEPKQLLHYRGRTLLRHAAETALASRCQTVTVVLGAHFDQLSPELGGLPVSVARASGWQEGMSASIRVGMQRLLIESAEPPDAVLILLCDQPLVTAPMLDELILEHRRSGLAVAAADHGGALGPPALFHRSLFPQLLALTGSSGAKRIIEQNASAAIYFPDAATDVDTPEQYRALCQGAH